MSLDWRATLLLFTVCIAAVAFTAEEAPQHNPQERAWQVLRSGLEGRAAYRAVAVQALSLLPRNRKATAFALQALHDKNVVVRASAATVLGQQHARSAIPALKDALNDSEISVVLAAAHSLLILKDPSAYQIYYAVLMGDKKSNVGLIQSQVNRVKDPKQLAQIGVEEGLGFVPFGGMGYEAYRQIHNHNNSPVRASAARFLANDPDPLSEDALIQIALADKEETVRLAALDALTQRGDPACIARLMRNLSDDEKPAVRYRTAGVILHLSSIKKPAPKP